MSTPPCKAGITRRSSRRFFSRRFYERDNLPAPASGQMPFSVSIFSQAEHMSSTLALACGPAMQARHRRPELSGKIVNYDALLPVVESEVNHLFQG